MKYLYIGILLLMSVSVSVQEEIQSLWNTGTENTKIEILQDNGEWVGRIKSSDNEKAIIGKVILKDLKKQNEKWIGKVFFAKRQKWYDVEITPNETKLDLIISAGILKKPVQWSKVKK